MIRGTAISINDRIIPCAIETTRCVVETLLRNKGEEIRSEPVPVGPGRTNVYHARISSKSCETIRTRAFHPRGQKEAREGTEEQADAEINFFAE